MTLDGDASRDRIGSRGTWRARWPPEPPTRPSMSGSLRPSRCGINPWFPELMSG